LFTKRRLLACFGEKTGKDPRSVKGPGEDRSRYEGRKKKKGRGEEFSRDTFYVVYACRIKSLKAPMVRRKYAGR